MRVGKTDIGLIGRCEVGEIVYQEVCVWGWFIVKGFDQGYRLYSI